jgi:Uma2 family endonuclease
MSTAPAQRRFSVAEYLALEGDSSTKHEFYDGEIFAMAGATIAHNIIAGNIFAHLHAQLRGKDCRPFNSDQRLKVEREGLYTYADASVICGQVQIAKDDSLSATNPRVIVEVLSPSTDYFDKRRKLKLYLQLDSLREYVLVTQDWPYVQKLIRNDDGTWTMSVFEGLESSVDLTSIGCQLRMADIYDGVTFPPLPAKHTTPT